jgi:hypothetical protein
MLASGQNLSGHVSFNSQEAKFYENVENRNRIIERKRHNGTLPTRHSRNPLLSEKTPRLKHKDWNFNPGEQPDTLKQPVKWEYPNHNGTIMGKFQSQKERYAKDARLASDYQNEVAKAQSMKTGQSQSDTVAMGTSRVPNSTRGPETARDSAKSPRESARLSQSARGNDSSSLKLNLGPIDDSVTALNEETKTEPSSSRHGSEIVMGSLPVTTLKPLNKTQPEILAKFRAERAAKYVGGLRNPIYPPTFRDTNEREVFKPGGAVNYNELTQVNKSGAKKGNSGQRRIPSTPISTARLKDQFGSLIEQLEMTNNEIARQELKIALNNSNAALEKSTSARSAKVGNESARSKGRSARL